MATKALRIKPIRIKIAIKCILLLVSSEAEVSNQDDNKDGNDASDDTAGDGSNICGRSRCARAVPR